MKVTRILIADDHEMVRQGLRRVLEGRPGWEVCAEATDGREAVKKAQTFRPDLVVIDFTMPALNGLDAAIQILALKPAPQVIMLTMHETESLVEAALRAGVEGFLLKTDAGRLLVQAVEALLEGRPFFTTAVAQRVLTGYLHPLATNAAAAVPAARLSQREREVVQLIAEGNTTKEVARELGISAKTVENHRSHILEKLNARSVTEIVRYAIRNGIIPP